MMAYRADNQRELARIITTMTTYSNSNCYVVRNDGKKVSWTVSCLAIPDAHGPRLKAFLDAGGNPEMAYPANIAALVGD